jgi:hypothetical protein
MSWLLRVLAWATMLALPCWLVSRPYQRSLAAAAAAALAFLGVAVEVQETDLKAPFEIGVFVAMCLASTGVPSRQRLRAVAIGVPALVAMEVTAIAASVWAVAMTGGHPGAEAMTLRLVAYGLESIPWVSAALLWLVLLGAWELPARTSRAKRGAIAPLRRPGG